MISRPLCDRRHGGFTMIELMVVVSIVAILAAIAIPNYSAYVQRSRIVDATTNLSDMRVRMEQYYLDNRRYNDAGSCGIPDRSSDSFDLTCTPNPDGRVGYAITARGKATVKSVTDFQYTIDERNNKTSTFPSDSGWTGSTTCWVTRKDGSCN